MNILIRPLITEKLSAMNEAGKYAFEVNKKANKVEIKKEIEKLYNVSVEKISTLRTNGKLKSRYTKSGAVTGRKPSIKKAIVTLKEGEMIDFYTSL